MTGIAHTLGDNSHSFITAALHLAPLVACSAPGVTKFVGVSEDFGEWLVHSGE